MRTLVERKFEEMGARVRIRRASAAATVRRSPSRAGVRNPPVPSRFEIDVDTDRRGEIFDLYVPEGIELEVLDVHQQDRHLLLMTRDGEVKARFLCGHDERHWFAAAIPEATPVTTVEAAREALKPEPVRQATRTLRRKERARRRTDAYVRQGEWFFVPRPEFESLKRPVLKDEPILRSRESKPHVAAEAVRFGGETVYVPQIPGREATGDRRRELEERYGAGVDEAEMRELSREHPSWGWRNVVRNPQLFVRGTLRHRDHATIDLGTTWHEVLMNTEPQAKASAHVVFLD
jgi:hypothetical protein